MRPPGDNRPAECEFGGDPAWTVRAVDAGAHRRVGDALTALSAGGIGSRGTAEDLVADERVPAVLAAGVYTGADQHLLPGPIWTAVPLAPSSTPVERLLDLHSGVLIRREVSTVAGTPALRVERFASVNRPGVVALRVVSAVERLRQHGPPLCAPAGATVQEGARGGVRWMRTTADDQGSGGIVAAASQLHRRGPRGTQRLERVAVYAADSERTPSRRPVLRALDAAAATGFARLLEEHRAAWARRWSDVDVRIPDDPANQLAARFALFQLWGIGTRTDECAVGARGLTGPGYAGHVFWDSDAFVLPAVVAINPVAARAMVRYRLTRLAAARRLAAERGYDGARFPWESAASGADVTPRHGLLGGTDVAIRTGDMEEHVTADVAWGLSHLLSWTGERANSAHLTLFAETARYWASRCRLDDRGAAHIDRVIGPDEYHEDVDDNAFTNVMARWNLRRGADAADRLGTGDDTAGWRRLADQLVDGYDAGSGRYEQFAGYFAREPLLMSDVAAPPVAVDLLLGRERVAAAQLIKQPDVLMLHHLVPQEVRPGSLEPNLDFYLPRTAHGSSLSPGVTATLLARAGRADDALAMLAEAVAVDLADETGMTAAGLHLANLAGVWTTLLTGFGGVGVGKGVLSIDPHLPQAWSRLHLRFRCLGRRVRLDIDRKVIRVASDGPLLVQASADVARLVTTGGARLREGAG